MRNLGLNKTYKIGVFLSAAASYGGTFQYNLNDRDGVKHKVAVSYYKGRFLCELKMVLDKDLREFVKKVSWLK